MLRFHDVDLTGGAVPSIDRANAYLTKGHCTTGKTTLKSNALTVTLPEAPRSCVVTNRWAYKQIIPSEGALVTSKHGPSTDPQNSPLAQKLQLLYSEVLKKWVQRPGTSLPFVIAIREPGRVDGLRPGETLQFEDARNRPRSLYVLERISPTQVRVGLERTAYLQEGILLRGAQGMTLTVGP